MTASVAELPAPDLAAKVAWLSLAASYPESTARVEPIETHMAWVFLTDRHAYKLKKPVRFDYLDFGTVEARRQMGHEEVRLNRRLAPTVYLDCLPLSVDATGGLALGPGAVVVDWLVKMRRLPRRLMLDQMIRAGAVPRHRIAALGRVLADFHLRARRSQMSGSEYLDRMAHDIEESRREVLRFGAVPGLAEPVFAAQREFLVRDGGLLRRRADGDMIVEGHGDLRPEHVCLTPRPVVIDCIEFNREFRILDSMDDLAYLAMECHRLGARAVGEAIVASTRAITGDNPPDALLRFYRSFRAGLRAKIALWHLRDGAVREPARWIDKAAAYLTLALEELTSRTVR